MPQPPFPPSVYHLTLSRFWLTKLRSLTGLDAVQESECIRYLEGIVADDFTPGETAVAEDAHALIRGLNDLIVALTQ